MKEYKFDVNRVIKVHERKVLVVFAEDYEEAIDQLHDMVCDDDHFPLAVIYEGTKPNQKKSGKSCRCGERLTSDEHNLWAECNTDLMEYELIE